MGSRITRSAVMAEYEGLSSIFESIQWGELTWIDSYPNSTCIN